MMSAQSQLDAFDGDAAMLTVRRYALPSYIARTKVLTDDSMNIPYVSPYCADREQPPFRGWARTTRGCVWP